MIERHVSSLILALILENKSCIKETVACNVIKFRLMHGSKNFAAAAGGGGVDQRR